MTYFLWVITKDAKPDVGLILKYWDISEFYLLTLHVFLFVR